MSVNLNDTIKPDNYQANARVCRLIERYPCLYDRSDPHYSKKSVIDKAWIKISKELDDSIPTCKERWRNIRTSFARSININKVPASANRTKPYYLHEELRFLTKHITPGIPITKQVSRSNRSRYKGFSNNSIKQESESSLSNMFGFDDSGTNQEIHSDSDANDSHQETKINGYANDNDICDYDNTTTISDNGNSVEISSMETVESPTNVQNPEAMIKVSSEVKNYVLQQQLQMRELHLLPKSPDTRGETSIAAVAAARQTPPPLTPCPSVVAKTQQSTDPIYFTRQISNASDNSKTTPAGSPANYCNGNVTTGDNCSQPPKIKRIYSDNGKVSSDMDDIAVQAPHPHGGSMNTLQPVDYDLLFVQTLLPEMRQMTMQQKIRFKQGIYNILREVFQSHDSTNTAPLANNLLPITASQASSPHPSQIYASKSSCPPPNTHSTVTNNEDIIKLITNIVQLAKFASVSPLSALSNETSNKTDSSSHAPTPETYTYSCVNNIVDKLIQALSNHMPIGRVHQSANLTTITNNLLQQQQQKDKSNIIVENNVSDNDTGTITRSRAQVSRHGKGADNGSKTSHVRSPTKLTAKLSPSSSSTSYLCDGFIENSATHQGSSNSAEALATIAAQQQNTSTVESVKAAPEN